MVTRLRLPNGLINDSAQNLLGAGELFTTGKVWYVDSTSGSAGNVGDDPNFPLATIDAAVSAARASKGDIIVCFPGHAENLANATTFQLDKAGLTVLGLGSGASRPTFTYTQAAGSVELDSANSRLSNLRFVAGTAAVVVAVNVDAANCVIDSCEFSNSADTKYFDKIIDTTGVDGLNFNGNNIISSAHPSAVRAGIAILLESCNNIEIGNNEVFGRFGTAIIYSNVNKGVDWNIHHNLLYNTDSAAGYVIRLATSAEGVFAFNGCGTNVSTGKGTASASFGVSSVLPIESYVTNSTAIAAVVYPGI